MAPNHYLNQWWNIVDWNLRNRPQWNFNQNSNNFIQENAFENVVCEVASILSQPQCVNLHRPVDIWMLGHHWFRYRPVTCLVPRHSLNDLSILCFFISLKLHWHSDNLCSSKCMGIFIFEKKFFFFQGPVSNHLLLLIAHEEINILLKPAKN